MYSCGKRRQGSSRSGVKGQGPRRTAPQGRGVSDESDAERCSTAWPHGLANGRSAVTRMRSRGGPGRVRRPCRQAGHNAQALREDRPYMRHDGPLYMTLLGVTLPTARPCGRDPAGIRSLRHDRGGGGGGLWAAPGPGTESPLPREAAPRQGFEPQPDGLRQPSASKDVWDFCVSMIGRADIEGSKSNVAMSHAHVSGTLGGFWRRSRRCRNTRAQRHVFNPRARAVARESKNPRPFSESKFCVYDFGKHPCNEMPCLEASNRCIQVLSGEVHLGAQTSAPRPGPFFRRRSGVVQGVAPRLLCAAQEHHAAREEHSDFARAQSLSRFSKVVCPTARFICSLFVRYHNQDNGRNIVIMCYITSRYHIISYDIVQYIIIV